MSFLTFLRENWLFLLAGVLLSFSSSYGQTFFIALFSDEIRAELGLSHGGWGGLYTIATSVSAALMLWAGALTDRFRVRRLAGFVMAGLALACLSMANLSGIPMLLVTIFALRFFGQGMMSQLSTVAMARWFVATRGRALSVAAMGFALGQAVLPITFVALAEVMDWRWLWVVAAGLVLLVLPGVLRLLRSERTPQSFASGEESAGIGNRHWTRGEMLRHPLFWCLVPLLLGPPSWGTVLWFQQVELVAEKGWTLAGFVALLPLFTAVSVSTTLASGIAIDRFGPMRMLRLFLLPYIAAFVLMAGAESLLGAAVALCFVGMGMGLAGTVVAAFWADVYGTRFIGAIKSVNASIMVFGSALGPGISGWLLDRGIGMEAQFLAFAVYFALAALLAWVALSLFARPSAMPA
ncbi:MFS transporter [Pseudoroseicyclus tamaricis]|uniref:MFS transporter n=1 Tax=Pseudoroseicyclus tamaricis TaxID=2705421 RepID=A0A6B2JX49_9RHOB|nr:MFS transporter [Pseudoroseicyclus tamaricis]NDV02788.1 MFS transporter [Pseudoroseicyclus tamaricis]